MHVVIAGGLSVVMQVCFLMSDCAYFLPDKNIVGRNVASDNGNVCKDWLIVNGTYSILVNVISVIQAKTHDNITSRMYSSIQI